MPLTSRIFFHFLKICLHFSAVRLQFSKTSVTSQTHFDFSNIGSNMHSLRATAIFFRQIVNGTSCNHQKLQDINDNVIFDLFLNLGKNDFPKCAFYF